MMVLWGSRTNNSLILHLYVEVELSRGLTQKISSLQPFLWLIAALSLPASQRNLRSLRPLPLAQMSLEAIKKVIRDTDRRTGTQTA